MKPLLILLAGLNLLAAGSGLAAEALPAARSWAYEHREGGLALQLDGQQVAEFVYRDAKVLRPFFANVRTPDGVAVTRNHPPMAGTDATDHDTMHPGVWLAFGDLNGQDFWRNKGRIEHVRFTEAPQAEKERLSFATECRLLAADGATLGSLSNRFTLIALTNAWLLVWEADFSADDADLVFGDQEEMGFGARVATAITEQNGGVITSSSGLKTAKRTWGQPAEWCDYSGTVDDQHAGITLMTDPANFRPSWWHNRDYGLMVANPFGRKAMNQGDSSQVVVKLGEHLSLRFGAYLHAGAAALDTDIVAAYRRFLADNAAAPRNAPDTGGIPQPSTEANVPIEISFTAVHLHREPFLQMTLDVVFTDPAGVPRTVPAFWAGGNQWKVRYASPSAGTRTRT